MTTIKQILMGIVGGVVLTTIAKPSNAITFTIGGTTVPGQGQFSSLPGVTTIDFESGAPTSGPIVYSAPGIGPTVVSGSSQGHYSQPSTVVSLVRAASQKGQMIHNAHLKNIETSQISGDEFWSFVQKNKKTVR